MTISCDSASIIALAQNMISNIFAFALTFVHSMYKYAIFKHIIYYTRTNFHYLTFLYHPLRSSSRIFETHLKPEHITSNSDLATGGWHFNFGSFLVGTLAGPDPVRTNQSVFEWPIGEFFCKQSGAVTEKQPVFSVTLGWYCRSNCSEKAPNRTQTIEQLLQGGGLSIVCPGTDILLRRISLCYNRVF